MPLRALVLAVFAAVACDNLGLSGEPERLNVDVEAVGADRIIMVSSTNWVYMNDPACNPDEQACPAILRVLGADSTTVDVPVSRTFEFTRDFRYYIQVFPADGVTATVRMTIDIDGKPWYDEARELRPNGNDGEQESLEFIYRWRQPTL
ncbi:MAG TPA: hypothetical protein VMM79_20575 [Longimicrobiales bacterium]|nr:hypothetical protein [Longimicrobiales bacterium]